MVHFCEYSSGVIALLTPLVLRVTFWIFFFTTRFLHNDRQISVQLNTILNICELLRNQHYNDIPAILLSPTFFSWKKRGLNKQKKKKIHIHQSETDV